MARILNDEEMSNIREYLKCNFDITLEQLSIQIKDNKSKKQLTHPIRFSKSDLNIISENSISLFGKSNISKYCRWVMNYVISEKVYLKMDLKFSTEELDGDRKQISFPSQKEYDDIQKLCESLDVKVATLVRYFAVNIPIRDMIIFKNRKVSYL
jgi:DNA-binding Xre family transcriptional regulator